MWLLNHPFYLLLLMAALGTAAVYYLLNFVADWQVLHHLNIRYVFGNIRLYIW